MTKLLPWCALIGTVLLAGSLRAAPAPTAPAKPNILLIVVDDIGVGDFGFTGGKDIPTPNVDRLAREGVICTSGYVQSMCAPTRAALMTGKYPQRFGFEDNRPADVAHFG